MLVTSNLHCERDHRILFSALSFSLDAGEALKINGANGAGKSTLLRIIAGLYQDFEGEVDWQLEHFPLYVGHRTGVKDLLTARENLIWASRLYDRVVGDDEVETALARVGMKGYGDITCGAMSEGQRKRINLARLYLLDNPAWILDEPFSAIDTGGVAMLNRHIADHLQKGGLVILTSHQPVDLRGSRTVELSG